jgi:hypothetical protein
LAPSWTLWDRFALRQGCGLGHGTWALARATTTTIGAAVGTAMGPQPPSPERYHLVAINSRSPLQWGIAVAQHVTWLCCCSKSVREESGWGSDEPELLSQEARPRRTPQNCHIKCSLFTIAQIGFTKVHHILPLPEPVDSPQSNCSPYALRSFYLPGIWVCWSDPSAPRRLFSHSRQMVASPRCRSCFKRTCHHSFLLPLAGAFYCHCHRQRSPLHCLLRQN